MNWTLLLCYQLPVFVVFGLFAAHRYQHKSESARWQWALDCVVILISASRTLTWFLPLSGHALFLTYAIGTSASRSVRVVALLVLIEAIAIKHFWLHDDSTPWAGIGIGIVAVLARVCARALMQT
jgi:hypothetical protein